MQIDFVGMALQALNVLILVWLLSRVFWRPIAGAIEARKQSVAARLAEAEATRTKADAILEEVMKSRAGIAEERKAALADAAKSAEQLFHTKTAEAREKAEKLVETGHLAIEWKAAATRKECAEEAGDLAVRIASKLLSRMNSAPVQVAFLEQLLDAIAGMRPDDRAALANTQTGISIVSAVELPSDQRANVADALTRALGGEPVLKFETDSDLIAGLELRTAHFVLHNSWRFDLASIRKELSHAA
ncbi:F0F1 ATP synthase subunit delta [Rhodobacteraceae bacterium NNCM2]|nr:F0F1 ATP synthase subunit delta [Coraliihabitans acroporae]